MIEPLPLTTYDINGNQRVFNLGDVFTKLNELIDAFNEHTKPINANPTPKKEQPEKPQMSDELKRRLAGMAADIVGEACVAAVDRHDFIESNGLYRLAKEIEGLL